MHQMTRSIRSKIELLGLCLLLSYCATGFALTEAQTTERLAQMVKAKQYTEAYELSNQYVMEYGGEPTFDFLTGIAALKVGEYQQAVFAFERAIIVKPKWQQARFSLAKGYYFIDNYVASKKELELLLGETEDQSFKNAINTFMGQVNQALLNKKRKIRQVIGLTIGHDSNINSGTTADQIDSPLLNQPIIISEDGKETDDEMLNFSYQVQYQAPISQKSLIITDFALFHTDYFENDSGMFESTAAQLSTKYQSEWGESVYQAGIYYRPLLLDGNAYRRQWGFNTNISYPINKQWSIGGQFGLGRTNYGHVNSLDASDIYGSVDTQYSHGQWRHQLSINYTDVDADRDSAQHNSYDFWSYQYQSSYVLNAKQQLTFSVQYQESEYEEIHPFFLAIRDEELVRASLGWRYLMKDWLILQANYKYQDKDSNLPIYQYRRDEFSLGVLMQF